MAAIDPSEENQPLITDQLAAAVGWTFCILCLIAFVSGCNQQPKQPITVSLTPQTAAIATGQSTQFNATETGDPTGVTWSVDGVVGGDYSLGIIDATGKYTAPSGTQSIRVTISAASRRDLTKSASATVNVVAPGQVMSTTNPQVALYTISPPSEANVSVRFDTDTSYGLTTWTQPAPQGGGAVSTFVAGMRANTDYHMQAVIKFNDGTQFLDRDHTFTTGSLTTAQLPTLTVTTTAGMTPQSGVELLDLLSANSTGKFGLAIADLNGNILWAYDPGLTGVVPFPIKLLPNGHFLINFSAIFPDGTNSVLQEVDLSGHLIWQMTAAQLNQALAAATCTGCNITVVGTHHDFAILPNGHLIVIAAQQQVVSGVTVTGDVLIDLDQNHHPVWLWNAFDHLDINRRPFLFPDWTHANAVIYSADDGNLIVSMRHQNWLVKVDYANGSAAGDILWHLGYQGDFTLQGGTDPTDWFYAQHGPSFVTTNTTGTFSLTLFDNGDDRVFPSGVTCGTTGEPPCFYSTVPILQINETAKTATLSFHPNAPQYSFFGGNAEVLKNGDLEYDESASTPLPANNAAIFEVTQTSPSQTVWQMQVTGQFAYRGMRIPSLYPGVQW